MPKFTHLFGALLLCLGAIGAAHAHGPDEHDEDSSAEPSVESVAPATPDANAPAAERVEEAVSPVREIPTIASNLHPATVHFPIGLLLFAAFAELVAARGASPRLRSAGEITAAAGGIAASVAAIFGWIHTGLWFGGESAMQWHRWLGTGLALLGPALAFIALRPMESRMLFRMLLATACLAILAQGWFGAELGHGAGHLLE